MLVYRTKVPLLFRVFIWTCAFLEIMSDCIERCLGTVGAAEFGIDGSDVMLERAPADTETRHQLFIGQTFRE
jgi:hypothetical protein